MQAIENRIIRYSLATVWLVTGILSLGIFPQQDSFDLLARIGITGNLAVASLYFGSALDLAFGLLTLVAPGKTLWLAQVWLVLIYTAVITVWLFDYWLHPFGPILKNIPFLTLLWLLYRNEGVST